MIEAQVNPLQPLQTDDSSHLIHRIHILTAEDNHLRDADQLFIYRGTCGPFTE